MGKKPRRPKTAAYYLFYLLFSTDFWRILMGVAVSILATPHLAPMDISSAGRAMLYVMVAAIGWTITAAPARWITRAMKKVILEDRRR
ncbi:MAG: hypothetical protein K9K88_09325 [Desulfobacterales bacterium]|nr:hypothetical protein [Desulfobacterales bacterium]